MGQILLSKFMKLSSINDPIVGRAIIIGLFGLLIVWLLLIPRARIGQKKSVPPWWRNVRIWALFVAIIQMLIYIVWGWIR